MSNYNQLTEIEISKALAEGIAYHQSGDLAKAENFYKRILEVNKNHPDALHLLGLIYSQKDETDLAINYLKCALSHSPTNPIFHNNLGLVLHSRALYQEAINCFQSAILNAPDYAEAFNNLGNSQQSLGLFSDALKSFQSAIKIAPNYAEAFNNLGNSQQSLGLLNDALKSYQTAIKIAPDYILPHHNLGTLFQKTHRFLEAINSFQNVVNIMPGNPDSFDSYICLANTYYEIGNLEDALQTFRNAQSLFKDSIEAQFGIVISQIPKIQPDTDQLMIFRENLVLELDKLKNLITRHPSSASFKCIGEYQPFFLAYQDMNNRSLLMRYGEICEEIAQQSQIKVIPLSNCPLRHPKTRIGIVSAHIFNHSVWNAIIKGWLENFDHSTVEIYIFYLGTKVDQETEFAKNHSTSFYHLSSSAQDWASLIRSHDLDAIIYPEICMDSLTTKIASLRLAPLQLLAWGHPETSGLPTIDFYISADLLEDAQSSENYSEKLIKLPNLGVYLEPYKPKLVNLNISDYGLDPNRPIAISAGAPFKYNPNYDWIFPAIAKKNPAVQIVFFDFPSQQSDTLMSRIESQFRKMGIDPRKHIVILPHLNRDDFYNVLKKSTVFLDTIGFSGFNTVLQAVECDLPIATLEGQFLRGRLGSGILKALNMEIAIPRDVNGYIDLVTKLCCDGAFRAQISSDIASCKHRLYHDRIGAQYLQSFIVMQGHSETC